MAWISLLLCLLLLGSCNSGAPGTPPDAAPDPSGFESTSLPGVAALDNIKASSWLGGSTAPAALPLACDGASLYWDASGAGVTLEHAEAQGSLAFAVYRAAAPTGNTPRLRAAVSPGAWLLVADYANSRWKLLGQAGSSLYEADLGAPEAFTSPNDYCYIAVVQAPGSPPLHIADIACFSDFIEHPGGTYYYVSNSGSDNAEGSAAAPWLTLQHAADEAGPGSVVVVRAGEYTGFDVRTVANAAAPLVFQAEPGVVITSANPETGRDGINVENAAYVTIAGFTVSGIERAGIRVAVSDNVAVQDCRCLANGVWGIFTAFANFVTLERNVCVGSGEEHGIYTSNSGDYPTIRGNVLAGNSGCGLHMNGDISMGGDGIISNALIDGNVVFDNGVSGGSGINCDGVQDSRIVNNLLWNNHASGISLYQIDAGEPSSGNTIVNNTVVQPQDGRWCMNIADASINSTVINNIFFTYHSFRGSLRYDADCLTGLSSDYNVILDRVTTDDGDSVITLAAWQLASGHDTHSTVVPPDGFAALFPGNLLQLGLGSAAHDAGTAASAPGLDITGNPRPQGAGFDCGAWELAE